MTNAAPYVCPKCLGSLTSTEAAASSAFSCDACVLAFPAPDGVPYLLHHGEDWYAKLREVTLYREFCRKIKHDLLEPDRLAPHQHDGIVVFENMRRYFDQACARIDFAARPRVLDVGAGCGEVSQRLAELGAEAHAVDYHPFDLHHDIRRVAFQDFAGKTYTELLRGTPIENPAFRRAIADADFLPYPDGFFDVLVLRATAHHFFDMARFFREANRVLRHGGRLLLIAEPMRSALDDLAEYRAGDVDYEEGMNERRPVFREYAGALREGGFGAFEVQCYHVGPGFRVSRWLTRRGLSLDIDGRLADHTVTGASTRLLSLLGGVMNLYATKTGDAPRTDRSTPADAPREPLAGLIAGLQDDPRAARAIVRDHLPAPWRTRRLDFGQAVERGPALGIRPPEEIAGRMASYALNDLTAYVESPAGTVRVELEYHLAGAADSPGPGIRVEINGAPIDWKPETGAWHTALWDLQTDHPPMTEIRIRQEALDDVPANGDRAVALAIGTIASVVG